MKRNLSVLLLSVALGTTLTAGNALSAPAPAAQPSLKQSVKNSGRLFAAENAAVQKNGTVTLKDSVEAMLNHNDSLRSIQENRTVIEHEITRAKAGYGPRVDLTARGGFGRLSNDTTRQYGYDDDYGRNSSIALTLTQPVWDGLNTRGRVREAEATYRSMDARVLDNANSLALDVIRAQVDVLRWQRIVSLTRQNVAYHERILSQTQSRASQGIDTRADVTQAQSRLARARAKLTDSSASLRVAEETYSRLTYLQPVNLASVNGPSPMYGSPDEVLEAAQKRNPKAMAYYEDIQAARARREQADSAFHPHVNIEAGPSYSDRDGHSQLWTYELGVAGVARWNLFNSGADVAEHKAANARIRQSRRTLYDYMDSLKLAVSQAWAEYNSARAQYEAYSSAVESNKVTRDAYKDQFILGQRSLLDVLDAESELLNSATQAATAHSNTLITAYRMKALAGDLLPELGVDPELWKKTPEDPEPLDQVRLPR